MGNEQSLQQQEQSNSFGTRSSSKEHLSLNKDSSYGSFSPTSERKHVGSTSSKSHSKTFTSDFTFFIEHKIDKENDSLASIALRYGVREDKLRDSNGLFDDDIFHLKSLFVPISQYTAELVASQHTVLRFAYQDQINRAYPSLKCKSNKLDKWQQIRQKLASSSHESSLVLGYLGRKLQESGIIQSKEMDEEETNATKSNEKRQNIIYSDNYLSCDKDGVFIYHYYWPNSTSRKILFSDIETAEIVDLNRLKGPFALAGSLFEDMYMNKSHKTRHKNSLNIRVKGNSKGVLVLCKSTTRVQEIILSHCSKNM